MRWISQVKWNSLDISSYAARHWIKTHCCVGPQCYKFSIEGFERPKVKNVEKYDFIIWNAFISTAAGLSKPWANVTLIYKSVYLIPEFSASWSACYSFYFGFILIL